MQNMQTSFPICRRCTAHFADAMRCYSCWTDLCGGSCFWSGGPGDHGGHWQDSAADPCRSRCCCGMPRIWDGTKVVYCSEKPYYYYGCRPRSVVNLVLLEAIKLMALNNIDKNIPMQKLRLRACSVPIINSLHAVSSKELKRARRVASGKKNRIRSSCLRCKKIKAKCSDVRPCERCIRVQDVADCVGILNVTLHHLV